MLRWSCRYDFYTSNRGAASAAVVGSLSLALGVPPARIRVDSDAAIEDLTGNVTNGTMVCVVAAGYTAEHSAAIQVRGLDI